MPTLKKNLEWYLAFMKREDNKFRDNCFGAALCSAFSFYLVQNDWTAQLILVEYQSFWICPNLVKFVWVGSKSRKNSPENFTYLNLTDMIWTRLKRSRSEQNYLDPSKTIWVVQ